MEGDSPEQINFVAAAFKVLPYPSLLLTADLKVIEVNDAFLRVSARPRHELLGQYFYDIFPDNPDLPEATNLRLVLESINRAIHTGLPDTILFLRYAIFRRTDNGTVFDDRYWSIVHTPVLDGHGQTKFVIHNPIDVTELHALKRAAHLTNAENDFHFLSEGHLALHGKSLEQSIQVLDDERKRLRRVFEQAPGFMAVLRSPDHIYEIANRAYYQLVGHRELIGKPVREALPELAGQGHFEILDRVYATGEPFVGYQMLVQFQKEPDAPITDLYIDLLFQPLLGTDDKVTGIYIQGHDITEQKRAQDELVTSQERWKLAIEGAGDGVWDWNVQTDEVVFSKRWKEILGYSEGEIKDNFEEWRCRIHPDDVENAINRLQQALHGEPYHSEHRLQCKNGSWKWILARAVVVKRDAQGHPSRLTGTMTDISEKKESEEIVWRHASFDNLTGLPNRRLFRDRLEQEIRKAHRSGEEMALLFIDLDRFKEVNDLLGHDAGDQLLIQAAQRLLACVRESDTVARLGGDEFTVILTELHEPKQCEHIVQKSISSLAEPFRFGEETAYISASVGITLYPNDGTSSEDLIRNADQAMYAAKNAGRNRFRFFTRAMQKEANKRILLTRDLRKAIPRRELEVHFQPIVELASGQIMKAEALLRWKHPKQGFVSPSQFIGLAEESGLIHEIGDWIFAQAIFYAKRWKQGLSEGFEISINRSPVQFLGSAKRSNWKSVLDQSGLPANSISIEITESVLLNASSSVSETLLQYRDAGIHVALDDFGTGYSSMSYLMKFDIDYLKIDKSFVSELESNRESRTIAESMILMAHKLGLQVIAEGVETEEQKKILRETGCDYGQGYLFSEAVPPESFEQLLLLNTSNRQSLNRV